MNEKDEVIEFLDFTLELDIPQELLKANTKEEFIDQLENTIELKIPKEYIENDRIMDYIESIPEEHIEKLKRKFPLKAIVFSSFFLAMSMFLFVFISNYDVRSMFASIFDFTKSNSVEIVKPNNSSNKFTSTESTDVGLYNFNDNANNYEAPVYLNEFEKELLTKKEGNNLYKIIELNGTNNNGRKYVGYLAVVYDPSKVILGVSSGAGETANSYGEILSVISQKYNAKLAMNAGGFYDPTWSSNGGIPHGLVISRGEVKTNFRRGTESGGIIGFTSDNKLILKNMTKEEAINMKLRDAIDWGPFLVINGKDQFKDTKNGWATARTAIGQRADGIVLLLVVDGRQERSDGVSFKDLSEIMMKYGAINAASLDGGTSTSMTENHQFVNIPHNGYKRTIRSLPNAWLVVE